MEIFSAGYLIILVFLVKIYFVKEKKLVFGDSDGFKIKITVGKLKTRQVCLQLEWNRRRRHSDQRYLLIN